MAPGAAAPSFFVAPPASLADMQRFVDAAMGPRPPTKFIAGRIARPLNDGKSGAHVFELEGGRVLKLYPARAAGDAREDFHLWRSLRDIVMKCITPDAISPHVYDCGVSHDLRPFMVMEKIDGVELFSYAPAGGAGGRRAPAARHRAGAEAVQREFPLLLPFLQTRLHDLHPHNIFVTCDGMRFIDFDLTVCPLAALRNSDSPQRQRAPAAAPVAAVGARQLQPQHRGVRALDERVRPRAAGGAQRLGPAAAHGTPGAATSSGARRGCGR